MSSILTFALARFLKEKNTPLKGEALDALHWALEDANTVLTPQSLTFRGLNPEDFATLNSEAPALAYVREVRIRRLHEKLTARERKIRQIIAENLPFDRTQNIPHFIKEAYSCTTKEILQTLRKTHEFDWEITVYGDLKVTWRKPSLPQRIRLVLHETREAMTRAEIQEALGIPISPAHLHYAVKTQQIIAFDRDLFGLPKHCRLTESFRNKAAGLVAQWVAEDPNLKPQQIADLIRNHFTLPPYRFEIVRWLKKQLITQHENAQEIRQ